MKGAARFGPFELDAPRRTLRRNGVAIRLQPQPLLVLALLVDRAGELVTREVAALGSPRRRPRALLIRKRLAALDLLPHTQMACPRRARVRSSVRGSGKGEGWIDEARGRSWRWA